MPDINIWKMINLRTDKATMYSFLDALELVGGPNLSSIPFYSTNGQPDVDNNLTAVASELGAFASWYYNTFVISTPYKEKREYFLEKFPAAIAGLYMAKSTVQTGGLGGTFGLGLEGSLHAQLIRPETVLDLTPASPPASDVVTWQQNVSASGWSTSYFRFVTTSSSETPSAKANTLNRVNFLVFGLADQSSPSKLQAYRVIGSASEGFGTEVANYLNFSEQDSLISFPAAFYVKNNQVWSIDVEFNGTGSTYLFPQGIQFVNSAYYQLE